MPGAFNRILEGLIPGIPADWVSVVGGFGDEDDLDVMAVDAGFFLGAEGKGCDGLAGGLGEQRGPMGGAVDVVLLDGYGDLGEDVIGGAVGREYEVCLVELVGLVGGDGASLLGVVQEGCEGGLVCVGRKTQWRRCPDDGAGTGWLDGRRGTRSPSL